MQREIENLLKSFHLEQRQEQKLINDVLAAIAVESAARRRMFKDIANAVIEAMATPSEATYSRPEASSHSTERDLTDALQSMLREAENRISPPH